MKPFDGNPYAESARREGGDLTWKALAFLERQGEQGKRYMETALHHEGASYFERLFDDLEEVKKDFELWRQHDD